ncbi:outer membrane protein assembly factor BamD [Marinobacter sp. DUT-3]|uniref:tetratricopeptide repeat protein n=1 Tax=Marinobacter sp. DUT-3 TaxID=3412036 RepID=UPI003D1768EC
MKVPRWSLMALWLAAGGVSGVSAQESFRVELGRDGETIADMRPVFLKFESRPMPAISPREVARRYQRLFDSSDKPEVRIDALNRLANIQQVSGQVVQTDNAEEQRLYREALDSYESIIESGSFQGKLDELLYQMAKAHAYVGQGDESIQRLKQLTGLYPKSPLVPEARFRIAEAAFSRAAYAEAEAEYNRLISGAGGDRLKLKARYMQGWSQYKQGEAAWSRAASTFMAVLDQQLPDATSMTDLSAGNTELVDDTLRVLALMAAETRGIDALTAWLAGGGPRSYDYLIFDRLADHYASFGRFADSVAVNQAFVQRQPDHPEAPAFMAQIIDVWSMADNPDRVREAREAYVSAYGNDQEYGKLSESYQALWQTLSRRLADYYYQQGESASGNNFAKAAAYYEGLSKRASDTGDLLRLAGDARLQAGQYRNALDNYQQAAYHLDSYPDADDAAWAAVTIHRDGLDSRIAFETSLQQLSLSAERLADRFPGDARLSGLNADIANRWLEQEAYSDARQFAERVQTQTSATPEEMYSAWLVLGEVHTRAARHGQAEHAWRNAATLIEEHRLTGIDPDEVEALQRQLATAVYRQGEAAWEAGDIDSAVTHFQRVEQVLPGSDIAIKGRYDAANSLLQAERWPAAINELTRFRSDFPAHGLTAAISDKLVLAYSRSGQPVRAASELMDAVAHEVDAWPRKLRAAEFFHEGGAVDRRNDLYQQYLAGPGQSANASEHIQRQTMRQRLLESDVSPGMYREQLVSAELGSQWHSPDTLQWSADAAMALGQSAAMEFEAIALVHPLEQSLARKQAALEQARGRFAEASRLDGERLQSEAMFRHAELYRTLAADLMTSDIPETLNELEQAQYQMLLEEEAYPFEEKAIDLHARNHERLADGEYSEWIAKSLEALATLFPGRYAREVRWMTQEEPDDA